MSSLSSEPVIDVVPEWRLPTTLQDFVRWLEVNNVPGTSDKERVTDFLEHYLVAKYIPAALRQQLFSTYGV
jgi:hypothetical protein